MAQNTGKCGSATISYNDKCTFICVQDTTGNHWQVVCPNGNGKTTTTSGEGREISSNPSVFVDGILGFAVVGLSKVWGRPVSVSKELAKKRVKRTLSGSQEEIARTLGLQLGAKRKARR
jgi:hypothetical protein